MPCPHWKSIPFRVGSCVFVDWFSWHSEYGILGSSTILRLDALREACVKMQNTNQKPVMSMERMLGTLLSLDTHVIQDIILHSNKLFSPARQIWVPCGLIPSLRSKAYSSTPKPQ